ncbi:MAG: LuxR C-terminal-related transcriptional regulator, partial [Gemmatimonadales bacterium]|nr:LuxR C-terminal-related transcriptional regulator [Gemmatimonadales bacterium]
MNDPVWPQVLDALDRGDPAAARSLLGTRPDRDPPLDRWVTELLALALSDDAARPPREPDPTPNEPRDGPRRIGRTLVAAFEAGVALREGRVEELERCVGQAADLVPTDRPWLVFRVASLLQAAFRFSGNPVWFERALAACLAVGDRTEVPKLAVPARALAGNVFMLAGRLHRAVDLCDAALSLADAAGLADDPAVAMAHQFRGYALFEWNRLDLARAALLRAWDRTTERHLGVRSGVARMMAEVLLTEGDGPAAAGWLDRLQATVTEPMTLRNREWLAAVRIRHQLATAPDREELDAWRRRHDYRVEALEALSDRAIAARLHEFDHLMAMLEAAAQWESLARVAAVVERGSRPLRVGYLIRALTARAVALEALGDGAEAAAVWAEAVRLGDDGSFVRVYIDGSPLRARLLHRAGEDPSLRPQARRILEAAGLRSNPAPAPLTDRQIEVLRLVSAGLSDRDAARKLGLSVATLKTHLRAIYERLGAKS